MVLSTQAFSQMNGAYYDCQVLDDYVYENISVPRILLATSEVMSLGLLLGEIHYVASYIHYSNQSYRELAQYIRDVYGVRDQQGKSESMRTLFNIGFRDTRVNLENATFDFVEESLSGDCDLVENYRGSDDRVQSVLDRLRRYLLELDSV